MPDYPWLPHVQRAVDEIEAKYSWARGGTYPGHDPSEARAADFWSTDKSQHDQLFHWAINNAKHLNIMYVISWMRIWSDARSDEGIRRYTRYTPPDTPAHLHTNHVHISFDATGLEPPPPPPTPGVPLMAGDTDRIDIVYNEPQNLAPGGGRVKINKDNFTSLVQGSSKGIDVTASLVVEGLKDGERVRLWWRIEHKKAGQPDKTVRGQPHVSVTFQSADPSPGIQTRYADNLPKAPEGWTSCLRLMYSTSSRTAVITRFEANGWKLP